MDTTDQADHPMLDRLLKLYDLEGYLFEEVSQRFKREQTLNPPDFFAVVVWKSNRAKTKVKRGLGDAGKSVSELMMEVSQADSPEAKVRILLRVWGIGLSIASAILAVCYPEDFTVLDVRAWTSAEKLLENLPDRFPVTVGEYMQYCRACQRFAEQTGLSLRDTDRVLWAMNWEHDLVRLAE